VANLDGSLQDLDRSNFVLDSDTQIARKVQDTGVAPGKKVAQSFLVLEDSGGSSVMTVDGSVTPVIFSKGPPSGEIWYLNGVLFAIEDSGTLDIEDFGAINELDNGWLFEQVINSTAHEFANFKTNLGLATLGTTRGGIIGDQAGFLNTANAFAGSIEVVPNITLVGNDSDIFRITVRDDLDNLNFLKAAISFWKIVT